MRRTSLIAFALLAFAAGVACGAEHAVVAHAAPPPTTTAAPTTNATTTTSISAVQQARIDAAKKAYADYQSRFSTGNASVKDMVEWSRNWYQAEHDAGVKSAGADHLARLQAFEPVIVLKRKNSAIDEAEFDAFYYWLAEAKAWQ